MILIYKSYLISVLKSILVKQYFDRSLSNKDLKKQNEIIEIMNHGRGRLRSPESKADPNFREEEIVLKSELEDKPMMAFLNSLGEDHENFKALDRMSPEKLKQVSINNVSQDHDIIEVKPSKVDRYEDRYQRLEETADFLHKEIDLPNQLHGEERQQDVNKKSKKSRKNKRGRRHKSKSRKRKYQNSPSRSPKNGDSRLERMKAYDRSRREIQRQKNGNSRSQSPRPRSNHYRDRMYQQMSPSLNKIVLNPNQMDYTHEIRVNNLDRGNRIRISDPNLIRESSNNRSNSYENEKRYTEDRDLNSQPNLDNQNRYMTSQRPSSKNLHQRGATNHSNRHHGNSSYKMIQDNRTREQNLVKLKTSSLPRNSNQVDQIYRKESKYPHHEHYDDRDESNMEEIFSEYFKDEEHYGSPSSPDRIKGKNYSFQESRQQRKHQSSRNPSRSKRVIISPSERATRNLSKASRNRSSSKNLQARRNQSKNREGDVNKRRTNYQPERRLENRKLKDLEKLRKLREDKLNKNLDYIYRKSRNAAARESSVSSNQEWRDPNRSYSTDQGRHYYQDSDDEVDKTNQSDLYSFEKEAKKLLHQKYSNRNKARQSSVRRNRKQRDSYRRDKNKSTMKKKGPNTQLNNKSTQKKQTRRMKGIPHHAEQRIDQRRRAEDAKQYLSSPDRQRSPEMTNNDQIRASPSRLISRNKQSLSRKRMLASAQNLNYFKNKLSSDQLVGVRVGLDMLDTDELMNYYKELVNKGKRDFITHHRQQNTIKKLENF